MKLKIILTLLGMVFSANAYTQSFGVFGNYGFGSPTVGECQCTLAAKSWIEGNSASQLLEDNIENGMGKVYTWPYWGKPPYSNSSAECNSRIAQDCYKACRAWYFRYDKANGAGNVKWITPEGGSAAPKFFNPNTVNDLASRYHTRTMNRFACITNPGEPQKNYETGFAEEGAKSWQPAFDSNRMQATDPLADLFPENSGFDISFAPAIPDRLSSCSPKSFIDPATGEVVPIPIDPSILREINRIHVDDKKGSHFDLPKIDFSKASTWQICAFGVTTIVAGAIIVGSDGVLAVPAVEGYGAVLLLIFSADQIKEIHDKAYGSEPIAIEVNGKILQGFCESTDKKGSELSCYFDMGEPG